MANVAVIGGGYVGLGTGAGLAEVGHHITIVETDEDRLEQLQDGVLPIYEPELPELVVKHIASGHLRFTRHLSEGAGDADAAFLALPTPQGPEGAANLSYMYETAVDLGRLISKDMVVIDKSTVLPGTAEEMKRRIVNAGARPEHVHMVANPEFLREGSAVADFKYPHYILVGTESQYGWEVMEEEIYHPFVLQNDGLLIRTGLREAEIIKYGLNSYLATRASFVNELANVCELVGADIEVVRKVMIRDDRVGPKYFFPGSGWGGSCLPKDTRALVHQAAELGYDMRLVRAAIEVNEHQKKVIAEKVIDYFDGDVEGMKFAVWGAAFKKNTDDVRESPALDTIEALVEAGASVVVHDPQANRKAEKHFTERYKGKHPRIAYSEDQYSDIEGAHGLLVLTDWDGFKVLDYQRLKGLMGPVFDARNLYIPKTMRRHGLSHISIGRPGVLTTLKDEQP